MNGYAFTRANDVLTAQELEEFIRELAQARSEMSPRVPGAPPVTVPTIPDASFTAAASESGRIKLCMRSAGFGWISYELSASSSAALRDFVLTSIGARIDGEDGIRN